jgi:hypothetical protein
VNPTPIARAVLQGIQEPEAYGGKPALWDEAMAAMPAGRLPFLDPADLPRDTSLQRAIIPFLEKGGVWHGGGFFLLAEDMRNLREGLYRDRFRALRTEFGLG